MIRLGVSLLLFIWSGVVITQDDFADTMLQANNAYQNSDYSTSIALYEELVDGGIRDANVYFNLGNAYYENGQLGLALLNYRRAQQINPRDVDIGVNIALVRSERLDLQQGGANWLNTVAMTTRSSFTLSELSWTVFFLWLLFFGLVVAWIIRASLRKRLRWLLVIGAACLLIGLAFLTTRMYVIQNRPGAVVIASSTQVMSGPGDEYLSLFPIFSAAEIRILELHEDWMRFTLPDGRQGWININTIELIGR
jgi:hypothetical protein